MIKKIIVGPLLVVAGTLSIPACDAGEPASPGPDDQVFLNYDQENGTAQVSNSAGGDYFVQLKDNPPERVPGVFGNAFRSDGYSTWVTGPLNLDGLESFSVSTWIALESYPSTVEGAHQNSALLHSWKDNRGFRLGMDTYGNWWLDVNLGGAIERLQAPDVFPLYEWSHVAAAVDNGALKLFLNGDPVALRQVSAAPLQGSSANQLIIARSDAPQMSHGVFEVNAINAAYDDTRITAAARSDTDIADEAAAGAGASWQASIAVPATRFADDLHRPRIHAMPPANWTNEPHGMVEKDGRYHLFYQRTPNGPYKWMMHWGHMWSDDLVNWVDAKDALYPQPNSSGVFGLGSKGIWSGDVVMDKGVAHAFYTTVNYDGQFDQGIARATSTDIDLESWQRRGGIIDKNTPNPGGIADFRDPYLWRDGDRWHMLIGAAMGSAGGVEYYTTDDLDADNWQRAARPFSSLPFTEMDPSSAIWEMPVFEYIGEHNGVDKYALVVSPIGGSMRKNDAPFVRSVYWTGTWSLDGNGEGQFVPDSAEPKFLDLIHGHLSPAVARQNGEPVAIGIVDERSSSEMQNTQGWAHTFSLPRIWSLGDDGQTLWQRPHPQLQSLRDTAELQQWGVQTVNGELLLVDAGHLYELEVELAEPLAEQTFGFNLATSPDGDETTRIYLQGGTITIDKRQSSNNTAQEELRQYSADYDVAAFGAPQFLRLYVDHSVVTVFINDRAVFSNRIYPTRADSTGLSLFSDGDVALAEASWYPLRPISRNVGPSATLISDGHIGEGLESGERITVEIRNDLLLPDLDQAQWQLMNLPAGVDLGTITRIDDTHVELTLSGNASEDYDTDITNVVLDIPAAALQKSDRNIQAGGVVFTAELEPATSLTLSSGGTIREGSEDGAEITVRVENNSFSLPLDEAHWQLDGIPDGLGYTLVRVDSQTVKIQLTGQAADYDSDIDNISLTVDPAAFVHPDPELHGASPTGSGGVVFEAVSGSLVYDFESGDLGNWCLMSGSAFSQAAVVSDVQWHGGNFDHQGVFHLWGFAAEGDGATGLMRTGNFVLEGDGQIRMLISGGADSINLYAALRRTDDDADLIRATGHNSETYVEVVWDASAYIGEQLYIELQDSAQGGWGHINLDNLRVPVADSADGLMPSANVYPLETISAAPASLNLTQGETVQIALDLQPAFACSQPILWQSTDTSVATVGDGLVTAVASGSTTILAQSADATASTSIPVLVGAAPEAGDELHWDFENGDLSGWQLEGDAFNVADISTATTFWDGVPFNHQGQRHLWGFQDGGDGGIGRMISDEFLLGGDGRVCFLISGGNQPDALYLALERVADGAELMRTTGHDSEAYREHCFDAAAHIGERLRLQLVDNSSGGFGHINLDDVRIPLEGGGA
ncbi:GH32 C-terminal domain-containing protein [Microbulbifer rhizosphaerae]|uniref:beta-fructofuranosidase n=1 Tax=Microbulbifer rhizosphaerae TaxID=1562603 RepID=A0A7W4ZA84_9GAMM|nr:GH32 C-terminal domain-containing protein [Microbulbifer rhizosphaerae]MBB3062306.1 sucrose-6-phosphate hydrolase SacC (GH32 family)/uncharacterized protein YjdB [Microbulbifer rhizosphaerae]